MSAQVAAEVAAQLPAPLPASTAAFTPALPFLTSTSAVTDCCHIHFGLEKLSHGECILGGDTEIVWPHGGAIHLAGQQNASRSVHLDGDAGDEGAACSRVDERVQVVERECGALVGEPELKQGLWWGRANA